MRIVSIGDNCIDIYKNLGQGFPGGGSLNFAVHSTRLGTEAAYIGTVGTDSYGDFLRQVLISENVDTSFLKSKRGSTAVAYIELINGDRNFIGSDHGVRDELEITNEMDQFLQGTHLIHTTLDGCVDTHIQRWKKSGFTISYDFSHRATKEQLGLLPYIDIAFFSGQKMQKEDVKDHLKRLHQRDASVVIMTLGEHGSIAFDGKDFITQSASQMIPVDTLGAGDSFMAGFCFSYLQERNIHKALSLGTKIASKTCTHFGAFGHGITLDTSPTKFYVKQNGE